MAFGRLMTKAASLATAGSPPADPRAIVRATGGSVYSGAYLPATTYGDIDRIVRDQYEKIIWLWRAIDAIASASSKLNVVQRKYSQQNASANKVDPILENLPLWNVLNRRANTYESARRFRYRVSALALLSPMGVFIEIVRANSGEIKELHIIPPGQVEIEKGQTESQFDRNGNVVQRQQEFVAGYWVTGSDFNREFLTPDRVLWIKLKPHPTDPYRQTTPLMAAGLAADTDYLARLFNRNFLLKDGRPSTIISVSEDNIDQEELDELKAYFRGGPATAGETRLIGGGQITSIDMSTTPRDSQYLEAITGSKQDLLESHGVPESALGWAADRTFDNADAELFQFWDITMKDHNSGLQQGWDELQDDSQQQNAYMDYDYSAIPILRRTELQEAERALTEWQAGGITLDEYRIATGKKPFNVAASRVAWVAAGEIAIGASEADMKAAAALTPTMAPAPQALADTLPGASINGSFAGGGPRAALPAGPGAPNSNPGTIDLSAFAAASGKPSDLVQKRLEQLVQVDVSAEDVKAAQWDLDTKALIDETHALKVKADNEFGGLISAWSATQFDSVSERLDHQQARKGTRHWTYAEQPTELKALKTSYVVQQTRSSEALATRIQEHGKKFAATQAQAIARDLNNTGIVDRVAMKRGIDPHKVPVRTLLGNNYRQVLDTAVVAPVVATIQTAGRKRAEKIKQALDTMDNNGSSIADMRAMLKKMEQQNVTWSESVARYASQAIVEGAANAVYNSTNGEVTKQWRIHEPHDGKTRATHLQADGQKADRFGNFTVGEATLRYPGDPLGDVSETAGCRCTTSYMPVGFALPTSNPRNAVRSRASARRAPMPRRRKMPA